MENKKINSIIKVTVNGMKTNDCVKYTRTSLETLEKSVFNIAIVSAYAVGVTIPAYTDSKGNEHGESTCEKPMKRSDYLKLVGRSKSTLSRWIGALQLVIDGGYFTDFAMGTYPFSYDKIYIIFDEKNKDIFAEYVLADLMNMSVDSLESLVAKPSADDDEDEETDTAEDTATDTDEDEETDTAEDTAIDFSKVGDDEVTFIYNDKQYVVNQSAFETWLSENAKVL